MINILTIIWFIWWCSWQFLTPRKLGQSREPYSSRLGHIIPLLLGVGCIFNSVVDIIPPLQLPKSEYIGIVGLILIICGYAIAFYSRYYIGKEWSPYVQVPKKLIHSGPYKLIRHPIYFGIILAMAGTVSIIMTLPAIIGLVLFIFSFHIKLQHEEKLLSTQCPVEYSILCKLVPFRLIPWIF